MMLALQRCKKVWRRLGLSVDTDGLSTGPVSCMNMMVGRMPRLLLITDSDGDRDQLRVDIPCRRIVIA